MYEARFITVDPKPVCTCPSWPFLVNWEVYLLLQMVCGRNKESNEAGAQKEWESRVMCSHVSQWRWFPCACLHISNLFLSLRRMLHRPVVPYYSSFSAKMSWHEGGAESDCVLGREAAELVRRVPPLRKNFLLPSSDKLILNPYKPQFSHSNTVSLALKMDAILSRNLADAYQATLKTVTVTFLSLESQISQSGWRVCMSFPFRDFSKVNGEFSQLALQYLFALSSLDLQNCEERGPHLLLLTL